MHLILPSLIWIWTRVSYVCYVGDLKMLFKTCTDFYIESLLLKQKFYCCCFQLELSWTLWSLIIESCCFARHGDHSHCSANALLGNLSISSFMVPKFGGNHWPILIALSYLCYTLQDRTRLKKFVILMFYRIGRNFSFQLISHSWCARNWPERWIPF